MFLDPNSGFLLPRRAYFTVGAGILFGFVSALAKTVIARLFQGDDFEWLSLTCLAGLILAALSGTFLVQNAHTRGTPELVVVGLTVIDPLVAVTIGITVLGEADTPLHKLSSHSDSPAQWRSPGSSSCHGQADSACHGAVIGRKVAPGKAGGYRFGRNGHSLPVR